jgi:RNA-splicing ligase RtcB
LNFAIRSETGRACRWKDDDAKDCLLVAFNLVRQVNSCRNYFSEMDLYQNKTHKNRLLLMSWIALNYRRLLAVTSDPFYYKMERLQGV